MDVIDAIMKIFADVFALNNISGDASNAMVSVMSGFFQGILAFVQMLQNMYEVMGTL
ncbi:MAG: hypothetical protein LBB75_02625 [Oscillospiraceae bacterium]|jgi:hypothetical protein|nr:hypothetical protein [Oscillospiraceae bacterium]